MSLSGSIKQSVDISTWSYMADEEYLRFDDHLLNLLTMAAAEGFTDMAEAIIINGVADVNRVGSEYDYSPLHTAMLNNYPSIVSLLLECVDLDLVGTNLVNAAD